jgi:GntR family transcriptional regulator
VNIWLTKNSEVPVREQLALQLTLGIAVGDLREGERLPSTRVISRRFGVHSNTVAAAYQKLVDLNMLVFRKGSGYYVLDSATEIAGREAKASDLIAKLFDDLHWLGFDDGEIFERLGGRQRGQNRSHVSLFEPDEDLRNILEFELREAGFAVTAIRGEGVADEKTNGSLLVAMVDERPRIEVGPLRDAKCVYLRGRSVSASLSGHARPSTDDLIAVASSWEAFLSMAKVMLLAANIEPGNLIVRSARVEGWLDAVMPAKMIICDALTANTLPKNESLRVFRLIADSSIEEVGNALRTA